MAVISLLLFSVACVLKKSEGFERLIAKQTDEKVVEQLKQFKKILA